MRLPKDDLSVLLTTKTKKDAAPGTTTEGDAAGCETTVVQTYEGEETQQQWGGLVVVTTSTHIPGSDDDEDEEEEEHCDGKHDDDDEKIAAQDRNKQTPQQKKPLDAQQEYAGNVEKYLKDLKGNMPSKKKTGAASAATKRRGKHGAAIAATRVDVGAVQRWYISDPANPDQPANEVRYPAAGTANADVTLHVLALDGGSTEVVWDRDTYPYLADVQWADAQRLLLTVQSRDQRSLMVLEAGARLGDTSPLFADGDTAWVELAPGTPATLLDGQVVMTADRSGARRLMVDGREVTPGDLQVRAVVAAQDDEVYFLANPIDDATVQHLWRWRSDGTLVLRTVLP